MHVDRKTCNFFIKLSSVFQLRDPGSIFYSHLFTFYREHDFTLNWKNMLDKEYKTTGVSWYFSLHYEFNVFNLDRYMLFKIHFNFQCYLTYGIQQFKSSYDISMHFKYSFQDNVNMILSLVQRTIFLHIFSMKTVSSNFPYKFQSIFLEILVYIFLSYYFIITGAYNMRQTS